MPDGSTDQRLVAIAQWLAQQVRDLRIQRSLARDLLEEAPADVDVETFADYLDGAGHPELAEKIAIDLSDFRD